MLYSGNREGSALDEQKIIDDFERNLRDYFTIADRQRREIYHSFAYMDCNDMRTEQIMGGLSSTTGPTSNKRKTNINLISAIVYGVAGSEAMQERHIDVVPIDDDQYDIEADIMDDCVDYAQHASNYKMAFDLRKRDAAICGIGATVKYLDMTKREAISGIPYCKRVYPAFLFYDTSGHGQDLNSTANWCGYVDPMRVDDLVEHVKEKIGKKYQGGTDVVGGTGFSSEFMGGSLTTEMRVDLLYHYFWRENVKVRDTQNPIYSDETFRQIMAEDDVALELMARFAEAARVDVDAPFWTLSKEEFTDFEETMEAIERHTEEEFEIKSSTRNVKCYYRAQFALGHLLEWSKSYSQNEYPLSFVTGRFDETRGTYYGLVRPLSFVQDALNIVMDDLLDYAHKAPRGGPVYVKGAADDLKALKASQANEDDLTPISQTTEIIPKQLASSPQTLLETAKLLIELMPRSIGIGQEFLGIISTGMMTDSLFGRIVKQSFAVLQDFASSSANASKRDGQIFIDMMLSVAQVEDGRILPILSPGHQEKDYIRLTKQNLARQYVIRVIERPVTDDERMENMKILLQLAPNMQQANVNILPAIIENMRIDYNQKQELLEMATPKPQEPNPMDVESVKANIRLLNAQAMKLEADAKEKMAMLDYKDEQIQSEIDKNKASAFKDISQADASKRGMDIKAIQGILQNMGA